MNYIEPKYNIDLTLLPNKEIINIFCYKKYTVELKHNTHANFQNSKLNKNSEQINILQNYIGGSIDEYLIKNVKMTYSDITTFIALDYMYNDKKLYYKYLNLFSPYLISDSYKLLFHDNVRNKINFNTLFDININTKIFKYWKDDLWKLLIDNFNTYNANNNIFWNKFANLEIFNNWNLNTWNYAVLYLFEFKNFWSNTINETSCHKWDKNIWTKVLSLGDSSKILNKVYKLKCYYGWNNDLWKLMNEMCDIDEFYIDIFENNIYLNWDPNVWNIFFKQKKHNKLLWNVIIDKQIYLTWNFEIWNMAFKKLKNKVFWENINFDNIMCVFKDEILVNEIKKNQNLIFDEICKKPNYNLDVNSNSDSDSDSDSNYNYNSDVDNDYNINYNYNFNDVYYKKYLKYKNKYLRLKIKNLH